MLEFLLNSHIQVIILFIQFILQTSESSPRGVVKFAQRCGWAGRPGFCMHGAVVNGGRETPLLKTAHRQQR